MRKQQKTKVVPLRDGKAGSAGASAHEVLLESAVDAKAPRQFPVVSTLPRLPVMIPDEILDYYGWVFCQGGFLNMQMTFEQFLAVVATLAPAGLFPEYEGEVSVGDGV
jgi:hypothetical protein